jgi:hypothetical protein
MHNPAGSWFSITPPYTRDLEALLRPYNDAFALASSSNAFCARTLADEPQEEASRGYPEDTDRGAGVSALERVKRNLKET